ncbi:MAG: bifunctional phosphoglucose/phosphomannose isomerase [Melioribacteraceae bacterium]|nr:bifunctional phosphoglucose/phosphomannose isomerase [Melioribacteraceae bacterium]
MNISELIKNIDTQNQFDVLKNSYHQVEYAWNLNLDLSKIDLSKIKNIIVTGLGGSAIGGDLIYNFLKDELNIPYLVNRNYSLPNYSNEETLVIASSYSGNTEETISALNNAIQKKCQIICVITGGKLEEISNNHNIPIVKLMKGFQPRFALYVNFFALLKIFNSLKLIVDKTEIVNQIITLLKNRADEYSNENNNAIMLAQSFLGVTPIIYSVSDITSVVAVRLKGQFNENSKVHAFYNFYPELDHNEIVGWESYRSTMNFKVINILDDNYHNQIKKRFEITSELIKKNGCEIINLISNQLDFRLRLIDLIYLGDWITYYLAILRNVDPTEIDNINYLKENL